MKRIIVLLLGLFLSLGIAFADEVRTIPSNDSSIVKIKPSFMGFDYQVIYNKLNAPPIVIDKLSAKTSNDVLIKQVTQFTIKFLDKDGFEVLKETGFLGDFTIEGYNIIYRSRAVCMKTNKIDSVVLDYSSITEE